jgi:hypothetical protein
MTGLALRSAVMLAGLILTGALLPGAEAAGEMPKALVIEVSGTLPGFRSGELPGYVAREMSNARLPAWRFDAAPANGAPPNRVEWRFQLNPYAGGGIRMIARMPAVERLFGVHRLITIETRLYLDDQYQTEVFGQATIQGGASDRDLAAAVARLTRALLGEAGAYPSIDNGAATRSPR